MSAEQFRSFEEDEILIPDYPPLHLFGHHIIPRFTQPDSTGFEVREHRMQEQDTDTLSILTDAGEPCTPDH